MRVEGAPVVPVCGDAPGEGVEGLRGEVGEAVLGAERVVDAPRERLLRGVGGREVRVVLRVVDEGVRAVAVDAERGVLAGHGPRVGGHARGARRDARDDHGGAEEARGARGGREHGEEVLVHVAKDVPDDEVRVRREERRVAVVKVGPPLVDRDLEHGRHVADDEHVLARGARLREDLLEPRELAADVAGRVRGPRVRRGPVERVQRDHAEPGRAAHGRGVVAAAPHRRERVRGQPARPQLRDRVEVGRLVRRERVVGVVVVVAQAREDLRVRERGRDRVRDALHVLHHVRRRLVVLRVLQVLGRRVAQPQHKVVRARALRKLQRRPERRHRRVAVVVPVHARLACARRAERPRRAPSHIVVRNVHVRQHKKLSLFLCCPQKRKGTAKDKHNGKKLHC